MKQYRITSENSAQSSEPDAFLDANDEIHQLKNRLASFQERITETARVSNMGGDASPLTNSDAVNKYAYEREHNIKPGTEKWFRLWFSKPDLTGEKPTD